MPSRILPTSLLALLAFALPATQVQAQQFKAEYYPFNDLYPAVQTDLNGDGTPDFIALSNAGGYHIVELLSSGGGAYTAKTVVVTGRDGGHPVAAGDFNQDGKADVFFVDPAGVAYGNGQGDSVRSRPSPGRTRTSRDTNRRR